MAETQAENFHALTQGQRDSLTALYERHLQDMIQTVRRLLRKRAKNQFPGASAVVHSVWTSLIENHLGEVDLKNENSVWLLLVEATLRHCNKWNQRWHRHPENPFQTPSEDAAEGGIEGPADTREESPEVVALTNECASLLHMLDNDQRDLAARATCRIHGGIGLVQSLTPRQRTILGLKLAGNVRREIAVQLAVDESTIDREWQKVKRAASSIVTESAA